MAVLLLTGSGFQALWAFLGCGRVGFRVVWGGLGVSCFWVWALTSGVKRMRLIRV